MTEYMRLFVGGLPQDIPETELRERFERYGKIDRLEMKNKCDPTGQTHSHSQSQSHSVSRCHS